MSLIKSRAGGPSVLAFATLLAGCQSYEPAPLDLDSHHEMWANRSPDDVSVLDLAARAEQPVEFDLTDGLALSEAEVVALVYNPDLRIARLRAGVARASAENAGKWKDPEFTIDVLRITESVSDPWVIGPSLTFTIPISGRLEAERMRADAVLRAKLSRIAETEWRVRMDLRREWLRYSAHRTKAQQIESLLDSMESLIVSADRLVESGEIPRTEAALFRIERLGLERVRVRSLGEAQASEQKLRGLMGLTPEAPLRLTPTLLAPASPEDGSIDALADRSPTLRRLRDEYDIAEQSLYREIRKQYPDLVIGPQYESDEGQSRIGFLGAIPVPILNANVQGIAEAEAERELARAVFETTFERLAVDLATTNTRVETARQQRELLESELLPIIEAQLADALQLLKLGEGSSLVMLESLTRASEARSHLIQAALDESIAHVDLTDLIGPEEPVLPKHTTPTHEMNGEVSP